MSHRSSLELGVIGRPRGLGGDVFVTLFNEDSEQLVAGATFVLSRDGEEPIERKLLRCARAGKKGRYVVRWEGIKDRAQVEPLVGMTIHIDRARLEEPEVDEFYYEDVVGYRVELEDGSMIGTVYKVFSAATDILIVRDEGVEWMLPVVRGVILEVDGGKERFVVAIPDGLEPSARKG